MEAIGLDLVGEVGDINCLELVTESFGFLAKALVLDHFGFGGDE